MKKNLLILLLLSLFILFPKIKRNLLTDFPQAFIDVIRGRNDLAKVFVPNSGEAILPPEMQSMKKLILKHQLVEFNLSQAIIDNPLWYQRAMEFNYPAKYSIDAKKLFYLAAEKLPNTCNKIDTIQEVTLVQCN